jgi:PAS domain S-box-containing protein
MTVAPLDSAAWRQLFEENPTNALVLTPGDWVLLAATDAFLSVTGRTREVLLGRTLFEVFPDPPGDVTADGVRKLRASLERVVATRTRDVMAAQRYPLEIDGRFEERYWSTVNAPVLNADGEVVAVIHRTEDVTDFVRMRESGTGTASGANERERLEAELLARARDLHVTNEELRLTQARVRATFDSAAVGIAILNLDGTVSLANRGLCDMLGYAEVELAGQPMAPITHVDDLAATQRVIADIVSERLALGRFQKRYHRKDGTLLWVRVSIAPLRDGEGRLRHLVKVMEDITSEREAAEEAQRSTALLRLAGRVGRIGGWEIEVATNLVQWSDEMFEILEYPADRLPSLDGSLDRYTPASRAAVTDAIATTIATGRPFDLELEIESYRGRWLTVRAVGEAIHDATGAVVSVSGAFQDITELKAAERAARDATDRLAAALKQMPTAIYMLDRSWRFLYLNHEAERVLERTSEELVGQVIWDEFPEARETPLYRAYVESMDQRASRTVELHYPPLQHWFEATSHPSPDGIIVYFQVITDRKVAEAERRATAERMAEQAALLDETSDAILVRDLGGRVQFWNRGAERLYGWTAAEILGREVVPIAYREPGPFEEAMTVVLASGEWAGELEQLRRDGTPVTVFSRWTLRRDPDGAPTSVLVLDSDVTERRQLERQFLRSQRLESIGTLAGGIAHDLNNALAPILMSIELLHLEADAGERRHLLETIESSARRGAAMVRQVLTFARGAEGDRVPVNLSHLLHDCAKIADETLLKEVVVRTEIPADLEMVLGDPTQLHQVVINLCVNARDAMPRGGTLVLRASMLEVDAQYAAVIPEATAGRYVRIEVEDSGEGMSPEVLEKVFDPFFTTKPVGKGTGLGLPTSKAIVEGHGGFMRIYAEPGRGTRVQVYLPASASVADAIGDDAAGRPLPRGKGELVLVVDDEPSVREVTQRTLEAFGYRVLTASDGAEGVAIFATRRDEVALVLTDIMMPVMDGNALIAVLQRLKPDVRIIAASGLQGQGRGAHGDIPGVGAFLAKPYGAAELLLAVARLLSPGADTP